MAENIATVVDWYGPYGSIGEAQAAAQEWYGAGLYLSVGVGKHLDYIGISKSLGTRINRDHHALSALKSSKLWLGEIGTAGIPGRRKKRTDPNLDYVEWSIAYFLSVRSNRQKTVKPPPISTVVVNRWWDAHAEDWSTSVSSPSKYWADVIEWDCIRGRANLCWFGLGAKIEQLGANRRKLRAAELA